METVQEIEKQKEYIEKVKEIHQNKNLKYYILTMGCQLNENDSEKLCGMAEHHPQDDLCFRRVPAYRPMEQRRCGEANTYPGRDATLY